MQISSIVFATIATIVIAAPAETESPDVQDLGNYEKGVAVASPDNQIQIKNNGQVDVYNDTVLEGEKQKNNGLLGGLFARLKL